MSTSSPASAAAAPAAPGSTAADTSALALATSDLLAPGYGPLPDSVAEPGAAASADATTGTPPPAGETRAAQATAAQNPDVPGPPPARNPWATGTPKELRSIRRLVGNGGRGGERAALALRAYNQEHTDDPRGHLLLGQQYLDRMWRSDAVAQFSTALQIDLSARGAPELLPTLIELVVQGKVSNQAEKLIIKSYGSEALSAVDREIAKQTDPESTARLHALRARLGS